MQDISTSSEQKQLNLPASCRDARHGSFQGRGQPAHANAGWRRQGCKPARAQRQLPPRRMLWSSQCLVNVNRYAFVCNVRCVERARRLGPPHQDCATRRLGCDVSGSESGGHGRRPPRQPRLGFVFFFLKKRAARLSVHVRTTDRLPAPCPRLHHSAGPVGRAHALRGEGAGHPLACGVSGRNLDDPPARILPCYPQRGPTGGPPVPRIAVTVGARGGCCASNIECGSPAQRRGPLD